MVKYLQHTFSRNFTYKQTIYLGPVTTKDMQTIISQKLRIAQKKNHLCKKLASDQFQSTLQILPLLKKVKFFGAQNAPFERPHRPNAMWCNKKFYVHHFFSTLRIFYVEIATSKWEGGLHIGSWETTRILKINKLLSIAVKNMRDKFNRGKGKLSTIGRSIGWKKALLNNIGRNLKSRNTGYISNFNKQ